MLLTHSGLNKMANNLTKTFSDAVFNGRDIYAITWTNEDRVIRLCMGLLSDTWNGG